MLSEKAWQVVIAVIVSLAAIGFFGFHAVRLSREVKRLETERTDVAVAAYRASREKGWRCTSEPRALPGMAGFTYTCREEKGGRFAVEVQVPRRQITVTFDQPRNSPSPR